MALQIEFRFCSSWLSYRRSLSVPLDACTLEFYKLQIFVTESTRWRWKQMTNGAVLKPKFSAAIFKTVSVDFDLVALNRKCCTRNIVKTSCSYEDCLLYVFFWVIPRRLNCICRRFETLCLFYLHRQVGVKWLNLRIVGVSIREKVGSEIAWADLKEDDRVGVGPVTKQVVKRYPDTPLPCHPPCNRLRLFPSQPSPVWIPQLFSNLVILHLLAYEDGTDRVYRNAGI